MHAVQKTIQEIIYELFQIHVEEINLEFPKELHFGDIALPIAMQLGKQLKKNPREIAQHIVDTLQRKELPYLAKVELAGPGYINLTFTDTI